MSLEQGGLSGLQSGEVGRQCGGRRRRGFNRGRRREVGLLLGAGQLRCHRLELLFELLGLPEGVFGPGFGADAGLAFALQVLLCDGQLLGTLGQLGGALLQLAGPFRQGAGLGAEPFLRLITHLPLHQRQSVLTDIIIAQEYVQLVENFGSGEGLYQAVSSRGMEGIVCKDLNSSYAIRGKDRRWQKVKNYQDLVAVIGGVTYRGGVVNSVLLGLYDQKGGLWYIGHAGTGRLTMNDWRELTTRVKPILLDKIPFINTPGRIKGAVGVRPELTVKVQFSEWTRDRLLRQPSIQAFVNIPPDQCVFE